jgi:DNA repair exonuclease SbcCD ATPase subunit
VDKVMDEIHEAADRMAEVQAALAQPASGDYLDEDELDAELAELQARCADLEHQLASLRGDVSQGGGMDVSAAIAGVRQEAERELAAARAETAEARAMVGRHEDSLRSLSQAYNALEVAHTRLEKELQLARGQAPLQTGALQAQGDALEADAEHEQEMSDLLVCLGQEESKVERLCQALRALGQSQDDIDAVLEAGIE